MFLFQKNQLIGDYTVVFPHKDSAYAQTYRVKDANSKVKFLKLIFLERLESFQFDENRQVIEIEIASHLNNPNLCKFVDSGRLEKNGHQLAYIVTEYVPGETLDSYIRCGGNLSQQEIRQIMKSLLSAFVFLHALKRPIIHNEVTIENIYLGLVDNFSNLKLIDFGASRFADLKPSVQSWRNQDLFYVANERFFGEGSVRSDLFSAGVVLYKLLFGIMPWGTNIAGLTFQEQVQEVVSMRNRPLAIPNVQTIEMDNSLLKILMKALAPNPSQRFSSAQEFFDALEGRIEVSSAPISMTKTSDSTKPLQAKKGNGFADVAGMDDIKNLMQKKIINVLKDPERAKRYELQIPNGMLLYGPPGCGKTFIAEKFAEEAGYNYMFVKSSDLASVYIHGTQEKIGQLFQEARDKAPTIINFDEFDALAPDRSKVEHVGHSGEVNEFLSQMNNCGQDGVFVIASTNRPDLIDPAVRRTGRLDIKIFIPVPDSAAREGMFKIKLKNKPCEQGIDFARLASLTQNFVASDIAYVVNDATQRAFDDNVDISQSLLEEVISENVPSVTESDLLVYEQIKETLDGKGSKTSISKERKHIGF